LEGKRKKFKASVLAMLDVSGSIEAEQLSQFAAELDKISKNSGGNLDIVTYDYEIQEQFTYTEFARVSTIRGGGGTSLNNALNQLGNSLDAYDLIVVMTDGIDDPIQVSRKLGRRLLVVLIDDGSQSFVDSVAGSGGQVIKIKM
jgi:predicted metal-dependent peptidase